MATTERRRRPQGKAADGPQVALVASGAGARGAYEAGILSILLPALGEEWRPTVFGGTSAGAINAALFAALAHLPVEEAVVVALDRWRSIDERMVMKPAWQTLLPLGARYLGSMLGVRPNPSSLLDTGPLSRSLGADGLLDWKQIRTNIDEGLVEALAVVTTEFSSGRTKVFFDAPAGTLTDVPDSDPDRAVDYVREELTSEHVRASAAIPVAFPPVLLGEGSQATWHMDGGVRLNTPLKPAITLGAKRMVVVATDPPYYEPPSTPGTPGPPPSILDTVDQVLHGLQSDRMIEDLITLAHLNETIIATEGSAGDDRVLTKSGRELDVIPFVFGGPQTHGTIGARAGQVLDEVLRGPGMLRHPDLALVNAMLATDPTSRGNLMSFLFFEPEFMEAAIELGRDDAQVILRHPPLWREADFPTEAGGPE